MSNLLTINNVRGYIDDNGVAQLNLEDVARGLGFTQEKNGVEYIRWATLKKYLGDEKFNKHSLISKDIFLKLVQNARVCIPQEFKDFYGITTETIVVPKEIEIISALKKVLDGIESCVQQKYIDGYKIDLYLTESNIAIECDEFSHDARCCEYEVKREQYIINKLNCKVIRFNPDDANFNVFYLINTILKEINKGENKYAKQAG